MPLPAPVTACQRLPGLPLARVPGNGVQGVPGPVLPPCNRFGSPEIAERLGKLMPLPVSVRPA
jgi:hypothetical protein